MSAKKPEGISFSWLLSTPKLQAAMHRALTRGKADPKLRDVFTAELISGASKATQFRFGRDAGSKNKKTLPIHAHISDLLVKYRKRSALWLFDHADKSIISDMAFKTFEKHVVDVRRELKQKK